MAKRIMVVRKDKCNPEGCGGYLCMRVSPSNRAGKEAIVKDSDGKVKVNENVITDADRIAANKCPFGALQMVNLPEELDEDPIHRYLPNGFSLYRLPIPLFGKVVGIIGRNGIGKSTTLNIIAGLLKPNLGIKEKEADFDELIDKFKGTEAQGFLEKLRDGEVKVSFKPQQVDLIPKQYDCSVRELLEKVDEINNLESVAEELDIKKILDRNLKEVSGGELQRVAIAAASLKDANLYLFDEPTSYLDIKQRVKVSKYIKSLSEEKGVVVIEHDLIILDHMTDLIHVMYGEEGAYGVCSLPRTTKKGINAFLEGYLKEENTRFRDDSIHFSNVRSEKQKNVEELTSWNDYVFKAGNFELNINAGSLNRGEVIGVLGENGIGKSTFAKLLSGEIKSEGFSDSELNISYKPQYLEKNDELVMTYLKDAMKFESTLLGPLNIKTLFTKTLNQLSGGELQRVAIAKCLSEDADLYLLDEPSAYLDVEQRLKLTKIMKDFMYERGKSAIIIDHDLLFLDYLSHKLLVFDGEPSMKGESHGPLEMVEGMNMFLKKLDITFRRDEENQRPRVNDPGSQKDREQRIKNSYYYG